ncbi:MULTISPECIES: flavodoxin family protein [Microbacterium]|uniref:Flavodoxin n=1 Tax=Microbacterium wangchenii TaxID=2541726 RepID=A0ABX5SU35_9MICO|nr:MULTISPECIES: NAD(P)H-dependent oxidoreductase [Microbacterium]MCK6067392.1 NAD(P)H-dependent oxidoreductase [Microbacterium sp. EYE_512]QBR89671.1 flavodoxin [Microbacterium wangchenii]TXK16731.1 flavodoxin family protein [Microbacterium wangchenii]
MVRALALNCTLKPAPAPSSTEKLLREVVAALGDAGVESELARVVDYDVRPGVEKDMGAGDQWPALREKVLAADILVLGTPTWMGHHSSIAARVLERLDAELSETDDQGRPILFGKVAVVAVVGNEDGAHKITADLFQALNDVGYTIPAQGVTYWNGEAMGSTDYRELETTPESTAGTTATVAANAAHLATLLAGANYPA